MSKSGGLIDLEELERITRDALPHAHKFDMIPEDILAHLQVVRTKLT